jgi:hypothetical protein
MGKVRSCLFALAALLAYGGADASPIQITIATTTLSGNNAVLAFDFTDGGLPANSATISGSVTGGTFGSASLTHDLVTFDPAPALSAGVTLDDTEFFTEYQQPVALGTSLTFTIDATSNAASPAPDELAFFLLDASALLSLVSTTDTRGLDALFRLTLGAADQPELYSAEGITVQLGTPTNLPEPGALALVSLALVAATAVRGSRR